MKNVDVIVIGGGMIGLSIAYWLTKKDKTVLVLEKGPTLAAGTYHKSALLHLRVFL